MTVLSVDQIIQAGADIVVLAAPFGPRGPVITGTSDTAIAIQTGSRTVVMNEFGLGFMAGVRARATSATDPAGLWFEGVVTAYNLQTGALTILVDTIKGSGVYDDWTVNVAGQPGPQGPQGAPGPQGPQGLPGISLDSPEFIGTPQAPTAAPDTNTTQIANCAYVQGELSALQPLSPNLTALAALAVGPSNCVPFFLTPTSVGQFSVSVYGSALLGKADAADMRSYLGAQKQDADLDGLAAAAAVGALYYRKTDGVWQPVIMGTNMAFDAATGTLTAAGGGAGGFITGVNNPLTAPGGILGLKINASHFAVDGPTGNLVFKTDAALPGSPTIGVAPAGSDYTSKIPSTSWVYDNFASLASPHFSGAPTAPTPPPGDNNTSVATTAFVTAALSSGLTSYAPLSSPALVGAPTAPTAPDSTNTTQIATTAYGLANYVAYKTDQSLTMTAAQQATARKNIGAALRGHLHGLRMQWSDANQVLITAGEAASDAASPKLIQFPSGSQIVKNVTAAWAAGNAGGADASPGVDGWWHVFIILNPTTGAVDFLFSQSATAPALPSGFTHKRRIGAFLRTSGANLQFVQMGDSFHIVGQVAAGLTVDSGGWQLMSVWGPPGTRFRPLLSVVIQASVSGDITLSLSPGEMALGFPAAAINVAPDRTTTNFIGPPTNTTNQIYYLMSVGSGTLTGCTIYSNGWIDERGRHTDV